ncbi:hypothetical protein VTN00DRAFT_9607 [Thermoascus crustaceus]|uniref:uncharacterized protein n=1 Tax=Thermoascus crustaceus TaxID=5088 RepID=UPI0037425E1E
MTMTTAQDIPPDSTPTEATPLLESSPELNSVQTEKRITVARGLAIAVLLGVLIFIQATNISMISTTQSDIAADLDAFSEATWFTAAYLIAMSSTVPLGGRLSQIFSPRLYLLVSSLITSTGLLVTAAARRLAVFLLGRVLTGCGSAGVMATSIMLVLDLASGKRRGLFIGMVNTGYTTGVAAGAVLAGIITPIFGWRLIYWVQAPVALLAGHLLFFAIPEQQQVDSKDWRKRSLLQNLARVDYLGMVTLTGSVILLLFSLASPDVPTMPVVLFMLLFVVFLVVESKYASEPIIPVALLRTRSVLLTCFAGLGLMMARWAVLFYTPVYAIAVRGWSPASAGLILVPTNVGFGLGGLLVGWVHIRKAGSYYISSLVIYLLFTLALLTLSFLSTPTSDTAAYVAVTFSNGLFTGALLNYTLSHVLHLTTPDTHFIVTSLVATFRGFAGSFGSAIGGGLFSRVLKRSVETGLAAHGIRDAELVRRLLGSPALVNSLTGLEQQVAVHGYEDAVRTLFLVGSVLALGTMLLQAGTGWRAAEGTKDEDESQDR